MRPIVLRDAPTPEDESWRFTATIPAPRRQGMGKHVSFSPRAITLDMILYPSNRILQSDDTSKFILATFEDLRFPDKPPSTARDYKLRLFKAGFLNGVQYRFYGHSNSQLRSSSCFLREANTDQELDDRIYRLGDFGRIMNVAKRAKRIGLLFSKSELDWVLDPKWTKDIGDIVVNGETFSDGCGLIKRKRFIFHGRPYTPCIFRSGGYRGYKGVLMLHPELNSDTMSTFGRNDTFSMVDHSVPYAFGRLNNDIIVLLASLGITSETLLAKQETYHHWEVAFNFLCALGQTEFAERLLLDGIDSKDKREKFRSRMVVLKSRLLFGVCDPYGVLEEGEVYVRVSVPRMGASTLKNTQLLVVRNPCLHPGDCLKLWAVDHPRLHILWTASPSMSSGGDLDGDRFLVMWDPDLVPPKVAEACLISPAIHLRIRIPRKEHVSNQVSREDLAKHFASYNSMTLAKITALHAKWVRCSPKGAMSDECQDLNALHSLAVDGGSVKIPPHLTSPPDPEAPYIIDLLQESAKTFTIISHKEVLIRFLSSEKLAVSEYETVMIAAKFARKHNIDLRPYLLHVDFGALATSEKHALMMHFSSLEPERRLTPERDPYIWNSLFRSEILKPQDLEDRKLEGPLRLQRLYSSSIQGRASFFEYLREATQQYSRRLMILKVHTMHRQVSDINSDIMVHELMSRNVNFSCKPELNENVVICSFMPTASGMMSTYRQGTKGYKLHCSENVMQLFNKQRGDSFVYVARPPPKSGVDIITSIALQKISSRVQQQCGRVWRTPVVAIEIHVVSNRDRVAHQAFDLRFEHVRTEEYLKRFDSKPNPFTPNTHIGYDWGEDASGAAIFAGTKEDAEQRLSSMQDDALYTAFRFAVNHRAEDRVFWIFHALINKEDPSFDHISTCMDEYPSLVYSLLKKFLPDDTPELPPAVAHIASSIIRNVVRSANSLGIASLAALERLHCDIEHLDLASYFDILWLTALSVRATELAQEVLMVLHECRAAERTRSAVLDYAHKFALGIVFDRAEEAADACPCDEGGRPKRQRTAPIRAKLVPTAAESDSAEFGAKVIVTARIRVDAQTAIRIHSHVRLKVASPPDSGASAVPAAVIDAVVIRASRGELTLEPKHPLPPEYDRVDWNLYSAGSIATSKAMLDAVLRLAREGVECCLFNRIIVGDEDRSEPDMPAQSMEAQDVPPALNASQKAAVLSAAPDILALIWGPPGTGKTTVVVQILLRFLRENPESKILMTASTHNAVDNVLERFLTENETAHLLTHEQILRVATESSKFTIDSRVGGSLNENPRLIQKAEQRVKEARIVFTTCSGAGLDSCAASQITEPCALIPLVKGCRRAVLVGDHVQLRPTVRPMGKALEFDKSLFERMYTGPAFRGLSRTMLDVQYRFSADMARFPSEQFYEGRLQTGTLREDETTSILGMSVFPWPSGDGKVFPVVFIPCLSEEDHGRSSKGNTGQVELVKYILPMLRTPSDGVDAEAAARLQAVSIAVLTPYSRQVQAMKHNLSASTEVVVSTIDGFQGREADIVVFSTVRSNMEGDIGFVEDARRLNVAWTRPRLGLIIVGNRSTLVATSALWQRALDACREVVITRPEDL
ncbi:RNA dependent RNA polymerase-domain-containing protein [Amylocystis lapponica]|nr:RNA dependent RNA polymerase-domain-containing protein [Amylocystis lapponica]